ncbi:MAG TPA: BadF/BadG/BcrA/BcrD ATPase family protein [Armatimonadota bacterium]|jgi:N-acetylglucosamine kinase
MRYAVGIDGGGSKCEVAVIAESGEVVGWGRGGATASFYDSADAVDASFRQALQGALGEISDARFWVGSPSVKRYAWEEEIAARGEIAEIFVAGEVDTAFACAGEDFGLVVLSGTGSFVYGRTPAGASLFVGGMGPILGDFGSGYDVGLRGARAAFLAQQMPGHETSLTEAIPRGLGLTTLREVFRATYVEGIGRTDLASLARVVNEQAEAGDAIARQCLLSAADEAAGLAVEVVRKLGLGEQAFPVIAIGSVAQKSRLWWQQVCDRILAVAPQARPLIPTVRPAIGGALLALRAMGVAETPELRARIEATQQSHLIEAEARLAAAACSGD